MERFLNAVKAEASALDRSRGQPRFATVTSVDTNRPAVRVSLQPEGVLTGWLPVLSPWVGAGWGLSCPPTPGDQVLVVAQEGDSDHGVVIGRAWSDSATTPTTPAGEFWLTHQSGTFIKLTNDGTIRIQGSVFVNGGIFATGDVHAKGNVTINGNMLATGDVSDGHGSVAALRGHYNGHQHGDPQGGLSSVPTPQD